MEVDSRAKKPISVRLGDAWFNLLRWIVLIAAIQVLNAKHHDLTLQIIILISLCFVFRHFDYVFSQLDLPVLRRWPRWNRVISAGVGLLAAYLCYFLAQHAVFLLAQLQSEMK